MTSSTSLFKALIAAIALGHSRAAIPWRTVNCNGVTIGGQSIDAIWDNARDIAQNAGSAIGKLVAANAIIPRSETSRIADNAKALFGIDFGFTMVTGLSQPARTTMTTVKAVFDGIVTQMQANNGYLWCGDDAFVHGPAHDPDLDYLEAWQYPIPGTNDVLVLAGKTGLTKIRLCDEGSTDQPLLGETLRGQFRSTTGPNGATQVNNVVGILLCVRNLEKQVTEDKRLKAVLPLGYDTGTFVKPGPDPDTYSSVPGTIVHEMVHFRDWNYYKDQTLDNNGETAYRYARAATLAKQAASSDKYLRNPDNYRVFAEMCMSPATRWGAARPIGVARRGRATRAKRSSGPIAVEKETARAVFLGQKDSPLLELEVRNASLVNSN